MEIFSTEGKTVPCELLRQRAGALSEAAKHEVADDGAGDSDRIDAVVAVEPSVLTADEGVNEMIRDFVERHDLAVLAGKARVVFPLVIINDRALAHLVDAAQVEIQRPEVVDAGHRCPQQKSDEANLKKGDPQHMALVAAFASERLGTTQGARGFFAVTGLGHGGGLKQVRLKIQILTIFPEVCRSVLSESILKRAHEKNLAQLEAVDLRAWTSDRHRTVDDAPYGGGPGMVMKIEPIDLALTQIRSPESKVILMTPQGRKFSDAIARELALENDLILLCGHYEGIDQRVSDHLVDDEISIGDYVLTSGVLPALVVTDSVVRLIPGVLGDDDSAQQDSFADGILDYPHYTRPADYKGWKVPEILLGGNHAAIEKWRRDAALEATKKRRPDLLES